MDIHILVVILAIGVTKGKKWNPSYSMIALNLNGFGLFTNQNEKFTCVQFSGSEYIRQDSKECHSYRYGNYSTLEDAKSQCTIDIDCQGVYDESCAGITELYHLCPWKEQLGTNTSSCVYTKSQSTSTFK